MILLKNKKEIFQWFENNPNIIFPTETVYGLGAKANDPIAIDNIYKIKNRPKSNPLIIHFSSISQIEKYCYIDSLSYELFKYFTPGPLTILLKKKDPNSFKEATNYQSTICCRIPNEPLTLELIEYFGPIAGPSCNFSGQLTITNKHMLENTYNTIPIGVFCNDENLKGIESTIIEVTENTINILREGYINSLDLEKFLLTYPKSITINKNISNIPNQTIIPGSYFLHYQIKKPIKINNKKHINYFHISYGDDICDFNLSPNNNIDEIIKNYFYSLFLGDLSHLPYVSIKAFPKNEIYAALNNKLKKTILKNV